MIHSNVAGIQKSESMVETYDIKITRNPKPKLSEVDFENLPFGKIFSDHMLVAHYADGKWGNPEIVPYGDIPLSPATSAIHYGQSIFEGMKAYRTENDQVTTFRAEANWERMCRSAERMCMPPIPREIFIEGLRQLLDIDRAWVPKDPNSSLYIRPFMFGTDPYLGVKPSETYSFMIISSPVGPYYVKPLHLKIETKYTRVALDSQKLRATMVVHYTLPNSLNSKV
jgi:branched-chain amino acid aminotransferase